MACAHGVHASAEMRARDDAGTSRGRHRARAWTIARALVIAMATFGTRGGGGRARTGSCPAVCAHRLAVDARAGDGDASAVIRWTTLRGRGIACADVDVSVSEEGALVVAHPSESTRRGAPTPTSVRALVETFARDSARAVKVGGEAGWLSLELKGDAFRAESYAEIDAMAGEAARRFGKRPRVFVFADNDYRGERWEIVRRSVRGLRNIKLAWAARDVEESARDVRNVDARALRARGIGDVVFPSVKADFADAKVLSAQFSVLYKLMVCGNKKRDIVSEQGFSKLVPVVNLKLRRDRLILLPETDNGVLKQRVGD